MKKMMKRTTAFALVLLIVLGMCSVCAYAADLNVEAIEGVVCIYSDIVIDGESVAGCSGTGFFVGEAGKDPTYLITNYHVVEMFLDTGGGQGESKNYIVYGQGDYEEGFVVDYDKDMDLAVLRIEKPTSKRRALALSDAAQNIGTQVYAIGYPALADYSVQAVSSLGIGDASATSGTIGRLITESGSGRRMIQIDANISSGNSGGPLVNADGIVLGVNFGGVGDGNQMNYAVSVSELLPLLNKNNVDYSLRTGNFIQDNLLYIAIGAAVLLLIVIIIIIAATRKKPQPSVDETQHQEPAAKHPVLCSLSPQHGNRKIPLGSMPALLGRTPECAVVYANDTPGVSKRHCQIQYNEMTGTFVLTDLQSTYGTFLANGMRLLPNTPQPLQPRDCFYLGEPGNTIVVDLE